MSWSEFSLSTFVNLQVPLVVIPTVAGSLLIARAGRPRTTRTADAAPAAGPPGDGQRTGRQRDRRGGPLTRIGTAAAAFVMGAVACAGWLSGSALSGDGPRFPPPTEFPSWQIWGCGITLVAAALTAYLLARKPTDGSRISPLFVASGFTTVFAIGASRAVTSQEGVGVFLAMFGLTIGLAAVTIPCELARSWLSTRR